MGHRIFAQQKWATKEKRLRTTELYAEYHSLYIRRAYQTLRISLNYQNDCKNGYFYFTVSKKKTKPWNFCQFTACLPDVAPDTDC